MLSTKQGLFILTIFLASAFNVHAQDLYRVEMAIKREQPAELAKYFDSKIKLSLNDKPEFVTSGEAQTKMTNFFEKEDVRSYVRKHIGGGDASKYVVGELITTNATYRVQIYYKDSASGLKVLELRLKQL